ncbi:MAG TPA: O-antigen ligase family protein [Azonexus sp.]
MSGSLVAGMDTLAAQPPAPSRPPASWPARLLADPAHTPATLLYLTLAAAVGGIAVALAGLDALFICVALLACVFIALDFRIGVVLLILLMPVSASALFPHAIAGITGLNPLNLLLLGTLGATLVHRALAPPAAPLVPAPLFWRYLLPITLAALVGSRHVGDIPAYFQAAGSISFNSAGSYLRDMLIKPLFMVLFAVLVGAALVRTRRPENFLWPMLLSIWAMGLLTIVFVFLSGASFSQLSSSEAREFFSPLGMHANDLGRCYAIAYALLLFTFADCDDHRLRVVLLATMGMVVLALVMTFSRGAFLGFAVVNVLFLISRRHILALVAGTLMLAGLVLLLPDAVFARLAAGWHGGLNAISAGRIDYIWRPLLPEVWANPVFGNGLGAMLWSPAMRGGGVLQVTHPHNAYLRAVLDMGFVGLILLLAYFAHLWRGFRRLARDPAVDPLRRGFFAGAAVGLVAFLATATVGSSLTPVPEQNFLWFAVGMMYGELARRREKTP